MATSELTELDYRSIDGLEISLLWNRYSGETFVSVCDVRNDSEHVFPIAAEKARDAFMHPYAYLTAAQGNSYPVAA